MPSMPFAGPAYLSRSANFAADRLVNMYLEPDESKTAKSPAALYSMPGLRRLGMVPTAGGCRGLWTASNGRAFAVVGPVLYELFAGGTFLERGQLPTSEHGPVSFADNGIDLVVVDGTPTGGWALRLEDNLWRQIVTEGFVGATQVDFLTGFFVFLRPDTQQVYISGLYDALTADPLDFASAEASPDPLVAIRAERQELLLLGTRSGEFWFNAGTPDFPLQPIQGSKLSHGCAAPWSLAAMDSAFYWLSANADGAGMVLAAQGYQPKRVSTFAVEHAIQSYGRIDDAVAYTMQRDGHSFYVLSFPAGNATWAYDAATGVWAELADLDAATGVLKRHRAQYHCYAFGRHVLAGPQDGRMYSSEFGTYTNDGDALVRQRVAPMIHQDRKLIYHSLFEVDMETGVGLDGGVEPGTTPQVMLQWSDDGGQTWSAERWATAGAIGAYLTRVIWRRLGRSRQRAYSVTVSDPVNVAFLAARIEAD